MLILKSLFQVLRNNQNIPTLPNSAPSVGLNTIHFDSHYEAAQEHTHMEYLEYIDSSFSHSLISNLFFQY